MGMGFERMDDIHELAENFYFVQGDGRGLFPYCNGYLLTGEETVLIDTGIGEGKIREIDEKSRIDVVIITHSHPDHILNWYLLEDRHLLLPQQTPDAVHDLALEEALHRLALDRQAPLEKFSRLDIRETHRNLNSHAHKLTYERLTVKQIIGRSQNRLGSKRKGPAARSGCHPRLAHRPLASRRPAKPMVYNLSTGHEIRHRNAPDARAAQNRPG